MPELRYYRLLGILFDEHLSFNANTENLLKKLARGTYQLNRIKNFVPPKVLSSLYHALIHSHLTYCTTITSCTSKTNINKITLAQKKAIRVTFNKNSRAHTGPLFSQLGVLDS